MAGEGHAKRGTRCALSIERSDKGACPRFGNTTGERRVAVGPEELRLQDRQLRTRAGPWSNGSIPGSAVRRRAGKRASRPAPLQDDFLR